MDEREELQALRRLAELEAKAGGQATQPAPVARGDAPSGFVKGLRDPIDGGAQLLTKVLPEGVVQAGNRLNNWIADNTGLVGRLPEGGVDQQVRENEAAYQAARGPNAGFDAGRLAGNVLNPANLALASRLPAAASLAGRIGVGALGGGVSAMLNPVTEGDNFAAEKAKQVATGAAFGAAVPAVTAGAARAISPKASVNPQLQALRAEGVRPTIGQTLGGKANAMEEKAMSLPIVGDVIGSARRGAAADLNTAAFNRALSPVGKELPKGMAGREAVQYVDDILSAEYNKLLPSLTVKADKAFTNELANLRQMVNTGSLDPKSANAFNRILQNDVLGKLRGQNALTGQTLKDVESDLGGHVRRLANSTDSDQRLVGDALQEVQSSLRNLLARSNPQKADELKKINTAWANFKRVQKAAGYVGAEDGVFSPAQLQSAVRALDRSKDKARFSEGNALMQDLSDAGKAVLGSKVPDSGTAGRLMLGGGAAGAALMDPSLTAPALLGAGAAAYSRPVQNMLATMLASRPQAAQPVANAFRQSAPIFVPLGAQVGLQALER
jgi:hypothetical protein